MPGLTITEKTHWKDRISARIGRAVERIKSQHPALLDRVRREARAEALRSLGLAEPYAELEAVKAAEADLTRRRTQAQRSMVAALRGIPFEEIEDHFHVRYGSELPIPIEVSEAIDARQAAHQDALLAHDPIGQEINRLEAERENLLDTVWLACSSAQIKTLWSRVGALLGDEPTTLEREALAIEPVTES